MEKIGYQNFLSSTVVLLLLILHMSGSLDIKKNSCKSYNEYPSSYTNKNCYFNPDVLSDVPSIIRRNGYQVEGYPVTTTDGYILMMFRILARNNYRSYQPIYLQNGILTSAAIWVYIGDRSLAFRLADQGYDVWIGSIRGSHNSKVHTDYKLSSQGYWNFSLDDLAKIDVSTQLNFIGNKTGKSGSIIYIGHSIGSTLSFMYASDNVKEANSLLSGIIALAPVVYFAKFNLINELFEVMPDIKNVLSRRQIDGLFYQEGLNPTVTYICKFVPLMCKELLHRIFGGLEYHTLPEDFLLFLSYWPDGVSVQSLAQCEQFARQALLTKYDYGNETNLEIYGSEKAAIYDFSKITLPVYLFYGRNDPIITEQNVTRLFEELGSGRKFMQVIPNEEHMFDEWSYTHADFILAKDLNKLFYPELFKALKQLSKA